MKYTLDTLRPEPGDIVLVKVGEINPHEAETLAAAVRCAFPGNRAIIASRDTNIELIKQAVVDEWL